MLLKHSRILCPTFELTVLLGLPKRARRGDSGREYDTSGPSNGPSSVLCDCDIMQELTTEKKNKRDAVAERVMVSVQSAALAVRLHASHCAPTVPFPN